jgi:phage shock protein A
MSYALAMSGEIHVWLAELAETDSAAAVAIGSALVALSAEGAALGPPVVVPPAGEALWSDPREALDYCRQDRLERMQVLRREVSDAAGLAGHLEAQVADLDAQGSQQADMHAARLRRRLIEAHDSEHRLREQALRMQAETDDLRIRQEILKARYTAAQAQLGIAETLGEDGLAGDDGYPDADAGQAGLSVELAAARVREVAAEIERELRRQTGSQDLMELRPGGTRDSHVGFIFAIEPPGTALLISVVEAGRADRRLLTEAVTVSADVLRQVRAGQDPQAAEWVFADAQSLLGEFFPAAPDEVRAGAAALVASTKVRSLADQRSGLGLTQGQVAARMSVRRDRVSAIERDGPGKTDLRTLAGYVEALGGTLEVTAEFDGDRVPLRW